MTTDTSRHALEPLTAAEVQRASGSLPELRLPVAQLQPHDVDAEADVVLAGGPGEVRGRVVAPVVAEERVPAVDAPEARVSGDVVSYYEANERARTPQLVERMVAGATVALITDAGMPAISDPGYRLVRRRTRSPDQRRECER